MNIYALEFQVKKIFEPLFNFIKDSYFTKGKYPNLGLEKNALFSLEFSILAIVFGLILACAVIAYHKQVVGKIARTFVEQECNSKEKAKTLEELGLHKNPLIRNAVCHDKALSNYLACVGKEEYEADVKEKEEKDRAEGKKVKKAPTYLIDAKTDRFYIPEELSADAATRYRLKGSGPLATVLTILALTAVFVALFFTLPTILTFINGIFAKK